MKGEGNRRRGASEPLGERCLRDAKPLETSLNKEISGDILTMNGQSHILSSDSFTPQIYYNNRSLSRTKTIRTDISSESIRLRLVEWLKNKVGEDRGWQVRSAELLGVTQGYLHSYLSGRVKMGRVFLENVASLGCDIDWLLTGSAQPKEDDIHFYAPRGISEDVRRRYAALARKLATIPPSEIDKVEEIIDLFFRLNEQPKPTSKKKH